MQNSRSTRPLARRATVLVLVALFTVAGAGIGASVRGMEWGAGLPVANAGILSLEHGAVTAAPVADVQASAGPARARALPQSPQAPTGTGFTYQGSLKSGSNSANGSYDFVFTLYDASTAGNVVSTPLTMTGQTVTSGLFTVLLDYGQSAFDGNSRYLELAVRAAGVGSYATLLPRQAITPTPYALFALKTQGYANVVVVAKSGGDYASITSALNSITTNSASNKYLVWIAPGTYTESVQMKQWVDIEGSGERTTKIMQPTSFSFGAVIGASNTELRFLTAESTGGWGIATAIYNNNSSPSLLHVTATASGGTNNFGVSNSYSSPNMNNVTATASGGTNNNYGVYNVNSSPVMTNVTASASGGQECYGVYNGSSSPAMNNVTASGSGGAANNRGVYNGSSSPAMNNVTATASGGTNSYGMYNDNSPSPAMNNVTATASGGTNNNYGVYNDGSSPAMNNVTASASGGTSCFGVFNNNSSSPNMTFVSATASGGTDSRGVFNFNSSAPLMDKVTVTATGANSFAIYNNGSSPTISNSKIKGGMDALFNSGGGTILVQNSQLTGPGSAIWNESSTVKVGGSYLNGFVGGPGGVTCGGNYNASFVFFPNTCP